jgi:uncharacterized DUF497 family protein
MTIRFEWDETKNKSNRTKHGIWFEEAQSAFEDPNSRLFVDDFSDEDRFILVGRSAHSGLLVVVHCFRDDDQIIRIISARKATKKEKIFYEEGI